MKTKKTWFKWMAGMTLTSLLLAGCSNTTVENNGGGITDQDEPRVIKLGAPAGSGKEMVEKTMKDIIEKQGSKLEVVEISDPKESLSQLTKGSIDAYLNTFTDNSDNKVTSIISVPTEPLALYSKTVTREEDIAANSTILIPDEPFLLSRTLLMLEDEGLIGIRTGAVLSAMSVETDVTDNPKNVTLKPTPVEQLSKAWSGTGDELVVMPVQMATEAGLTDKEELDTEDVPESLSNRLVVRAADQNTTYARTIKEVIQSTEYEKLLDQYFPNFDKPEWMD
ncbi:MetQ/NlpA family ABC transporter substrate-binding protein [Paenibacillus sp. Marseille-Q4541]|uniref:MetQ/NlpA family ABC transporter substrate-binding protein n=1 Tax=Paenibacillus sp. Marseille-Q4541 TaxID=2831522 RepID=UPI001BA6F225|nr:MetQ/NlpA family ABC transporter substrate-binding protein [Paenibacillus sp. Marseille-Q4541]